MEFQASNLAWSKTTLRVFFCAYGEIFKNTFFYRTPPNDCFSKNILQNTSEGLLLRDVNSEFENLRKTLTGSCFYMQLRIINVFLFENLRKTLTGNLSYIHLRIINVFLGIFQHPEIHHNNCFSKQPWTAIFVLPFDLALVLDFKINELINQNENQLAFSIRKIKNWF